VPLLRGDGEAASAGDAKAPRAPDALSTIFDILRFKLKVDEAAPPPNAQDGMGMVSAGSDVEGNGGGMGEATVPTESGGEDGEWGGDVEMGVEADDKDKDSASTLGIMRRM
ncbi:hypothetical protein CYMTET_18399, partial [Cymbomonas tetramitiformis]